MTQPTTSSEREVHSTHQMVEGLHARFDGFAREIADLRRDHGLLLREVGMIDARMSTVEAVASVQQGANQRSTDATNAVIAAIEGRLDKMMMGVVVTMLSALFGAGTLLYQTLWAAASRAAGT